MMQKEPVHILGGGGHGAVVIQLLRACGYAIAGFYDDNPKETVILGVSCLGGISSIRSDSNFHSVIAIGGNETRKAIAAKFPNLVWLTLIHPFAAVDSSVSVGPGTVILAGAVVQPRARIGEHVIVNANSLVDHDARVESYSHVAQGAIVGSGSTVSEGAFIGLRGVASSGGLIEPWQKIPPGSISG